MYLLTKCFPIRVNKITLTTATNVLYSFICKIWIAPLMRLHYFFVRTYFLLLKRKEKTDVKIFLNAICAPYLTHSYEMRSE